VGVRVLSLVFLVSCAKAAAVSPYLAPGYAGARPPKDRAMVELIRDSSREKKTLTLVTETDGKFVAHVGAASRTRAFMTPGRRLLFFAGARDNVFTRALPLWVDLKPGKTYIVHVDVEGNAEMNPIPVRPDQTNEWRYFRAWREETPLFFVSKVPEAPVVSPGVRESWYAGYSQMWEKEMNDAERDAHTLHAEDGR
jgi:hypothetical protein